MRKLSLTMALAACGLALVSCGDREKGAPAAEKPAYKPPPVPFVVGKIDVDKDAAEPAVRLSIAVDAATPAADIERLLNYFDKDRYADFDIVWVNVYFDAAKARLPAEDARAVVASLRVNRPSFRELKLSEDFLAPGELEGAAPEVTNRTEETVYLGKRGRMFDSAKQAQVLADTMAEKPGHAIYRLVWQGPMNCELTYSVEQEMLVRVRDGVSRETWAEFAYDDIKKAARGAGFGGRSRHGGNYTYIKESAGGDDAGTE